MWCVTSESADNAHIARLLAHRVELSAPKMVDVWSAWCVGNDLAINSRVFLFGSLLCGALRGLLLLL